MATTCTIHLFSFQKMTPCTERSKSRFLHISCVCGENNDRCKWTCSVYTAWIKEPMESIWMWDELWTKTCVFITVPPPPWLTWVNCFARQVWTISYAPENLTFLHLCGPHNHFYRRKKNINESRNKHNRIPIWLVLDFSQQLLSQQWDYQRPNNINFFLNQRP